jgi:sulfite reductase (ferredoxin)
MQSFRHELEGLNPVVAQDIITLADKIQLFKEGKIDEEKFRSLRLARGVYGQRQAGVQMIRIKIPFGKLTTAQLLRICSVADEYSDGKLHATTRQDIQIHYVSLDRTPQLWADLEKDGVTLREACGNTVRNITASDKAGIDKDELFDVSPYAQEMFKYLLRNPICQEMGRKFKIAFSASEQDSALVYIHDLGFIPKIRQENGKEVRGFKVVMGGGLGAQPHLALVAHEFLHEDQIIPFTESILRVFDRYGERLRRHKARFKFLLQDIGLEEVMRLAAEEEKAIPFRTYKINRESIVQPAPQPADKTYTIPSEYNLEKYDAWRATNVFEQKQAGFYGVFIKLTLGNMTTATARQLAEIVKEYAADEVRVTINQGYMLKFVREAALLPLFAALDKIGLAEPGFDSIADITACPGTDTCNLGISSSTGIAVALEKVITEEYPDLIYNNQIKIKISGCPNSCGQHGIATIGFHGSSLKNGKLVLPALQVLLGGSPTRVADKVIKVPSKRGPDALRFLLDDYETNAAEGEYFLDYYLRQGQNYFYNLLKPLAEMTTLTQEDYIDWGQEDNFKIETAVGECAGVIIDLFATLMYDSDEKLGWSLQALGDKKYADAIYHAYNAMINAAKALLLSKDVKNSSQHAVMKDFDRLFVETGDISLPTSFSEYVLQINKNEPTEAFAKNYLQNAIDFVQAVRNVREAQPIEG